MSKAPSWQSHGGQYLTVSIDQPHPVGNIRGTLPSREEGNDHERNRLRRNMAYPQTGEAVHQGGVIRPHINNELLAQEQVHGLRRVAHGVWLTAPSLAIRFIVPRGPGGLSRRNGRALRTCRIQAKRRQAAPAHSSRPPPPQSPPGSPIRHCQGRTEHQVHRTRFAQEGSRHRKAMMPTGPSGGHPAGPARRPATASTKPVKRSSSSRRPARRRTAPLPLPKHYQPRSTHAQRKRPQKQGRRPHSPRPMPGSAVVAPPSLPPRWALLSSGWSYRGEMTWPVSTRAAAPRRTARP